MTKSSCASSRTSRSAKASPAAEALRDPTTATIGRANTDRSPRTQITGGGASISRRAFGIFAIAGDDEARAHAPRRLELALAIGALCDGDAAAAAMAGD